MDKITNSLMFGIICIDKMWNNDPGLPQPRGINKVE